MKLNMSITEAIDFYKRENPELKAQCKAFCESTENGLQQNWGDEFTELQKYLKSKLYEVKVILEAMDDDEEICERNLQEKMNSHFNLSYEFYICSDIVREIADSYLAKC